MAASPLVCQPRRANADAFQTARFPKGAVSKRRGFERARLWGQESGWLRGGEAERLTRRSAEYQQLGAPEAVATETAAMLDRLTLADPIEVEPPFADDLAAAEKA